MGEMHTEKDGDCFLDRENNRWQEPDLKISQDLVNLLKIEHLQYQKLNIDNLFDQKIGDLYKKLNYKPEEPQIFFDTSIPEIADEIVLVDEQSKIDLLGKLTGRQLRNVKIEIDGKILNYFDVYIDGMSTSDYEENFDGEEYNKLGYYDEDDDEDDEVIVYIAPSYELAGDGTVHNNPDNMFYQTCIDQIKEIIVGSKKYRFLG